jgi:ABC-type multidrug transport system ATPase subunit
LLGLNGAGKTTTLQIVTGQLSKTTGDAFINGYEIGTLSFDASNNMGFCPQFEYLPEFLTVEQTLNLFADLRGLRKDVKKTIVNEFIDVFKLNEFKNKLVQNLSGGNKRKVSSAIAFIGNPSTVILDEVSEIANIMTTNITD